MLKYDGTLAECAYFPDYQTGYSTYKKEKEKANGQNYQN